MHDYTTAYHSLVDGHLGSFQFGANMNKAIMNILVQSFLGICFPLLLDKYLGVELFGS